MDGVRNWLLSRTFKPDIVLLAGFADLVNIPGKFLSSPQPV